MDLWQRVFHKGNRDIDPIYVQPADEIASFVHAFHFYLHLKLEENMLVNYSNIRSIKNELRQTWSRKKTNYKV